MINSKQGFQEVGKLIVFTITILVALGLIAFMLFYYNENKEIQRNSSVLGSVHSDVADMNQIPGISGCTGSPTFNAISQVYTASGCVGLENIKGLKDVNPATFEYKINYLSE